MEDKEKAVISAFENSKRPLRPKDIEKITGIPSKEISKIIKELREKGLVHSPKRCYYALLKSDK